MNRFYNGRLSLTYNSQHQNRLIDSILKKNVGPILIYLSTATSNDTHIHVGKFSYTVM